MANDTYIRIDSKLKRDLKIMAAKKGSTIKELANQFIIDGLTREIKKEAKNNENDYKEP